MSEKAIIRTQKQNSLKFEWERVPLESLRLETDGDESIPEPLRYRSSVYTFGGMDSFSSEAVSMLLQLHPIFVMRKQRKLLVIAGKRSFHTAAHCLKPDQEITIALLDRKTSNEQLLLLNYLDQIVTPLFFRQNSSMADIYRSINLPEFRRQVWLPPLSTSMRAFAESLGVSAAALCATPRRREETGNNAGAADVTLQGSESH